ncbi:MAG: HEAT repeat domain-containing protein [Christensenellales bacterium]|uniref:HEAT repeat domain-containing protein n=1 Tax=Candidatus Avichristensenella intestinipullorum TaxID=2840693 RepID=A0A9D1CIL4_9FIRM|nr:HEAT repeat domain-containing protein [Christensenellales bacterium]HIQ63246.1 HEAT repeat domain-containing protein [Candidatus Avichristensenella intestinipullorum]
MFEGKQEKIRKLAEKKKSGKIVQHLGDKDMNVVLAAVAGLGECGDETAYNALVPLLHNQNAPLRAAAAEALGKTGNSAASTHLRYQLKNESDPSVQKAIHSALTMLADAR